MRTLAIPVVVFMAASLAACGSASDTVNGADTTSASDSSTTDSSTPTSAPASTSSTPSSTGSSSTAPTSASTTGSDPGSTYCTELRSAKAQFQNMNFQNLNTEQFQQLTTEFDTLAATAPDAVKDDWTTLSTALKQVQQILADASLSFDDLKSLSSGHLPPGVTVSQLKKLTRQLQQFSRDTHYQAAAAAISLDARSECGITMGS